MGWDVLSDSRNDMKHIDATSTIYQGCTISTAMTICCGILTFIYLHIYLAIYVSIYLSIYLFVYVCIYLSIYSMESKLGWFCVKSMVSKAVRTGCCYPPRYVGITPATGPVTASHVGSLPGVATWPGEMWGTYWARWISTKMRVAEKKNILCRNHLESKKRNSAPTFCVDSDVVDIW